MRKQKFQTVTTLAARFFCSRQYIHFLIKEKKIKPSLSLSMYLFTEKNAERIRAKYFPYIPKKEG